MARILVFKIKPSQKILKIRDGTPLKVEVILTYRKSPRNCSVWQFSSKLDVPSNVVQKKRVACILVFNIRPSQEILKIRDGTPLEAEGILTYRKSPRNCSVWQFSSKLDVPSNVVQKKRLERILVFKIRPSKEILKIRDGTPLEAEEILTYRKSPRYCSVWHFSSKPSQNVLKIRDGTPLEAEGILTYRKGLRNCSVWHFSSKLDIPNNVVQEKRVARILVFKIRPSQKILKIRDGTPLEAEGILKYGKSPRNCSVWNFSSKLDVPSNVVKRERVARILVFKIRPSQKILKIRDGTPLEAEGILTYRKSPRNCSIWHFSSKPSQKILKIRDGTPLKAEGILTYRKSPRNCSVWHFSSKLDVPSNVVQKKRVARILVFKIRSSQEILKIRDGTPLEAEEILTYRKALDTARFGTFLVNVPTNEVRKERMARILVFKIKPSQKILKIRDGTPLKAEGILTYRKSPRNCSVWQFSSKLDVPSNVVQKKRVACILVFNIRPSQEILKIRDGTPLEAEGILTYRKSPRNCSVWQFSSKLDVPSNVVQKKRLERILVFKIRPSKEILKIRDGTPLEAEEILTYRKSPRYCSVWHFSSKPSQNVLKIRDGTPLEAEGILTYRKGLRNCSVWHFSSKLDIPNNVVQKKRVARILVFKIRPSQKILKIRDGTPLEAEGILKYGKSPRNCSVWNFSSKLDVPSNVVKRERVARILVFKIRPSQKILKIRDGTPLEAEGILTYRKSPRNCSIWHFSRILTYRKSPRNCSVWHFSSKLDVPSNVVQKKRVARILVFKIRSSQEILKIRDGTPLEAEEILTYRKALDTARFGTFLLDVPTNEVQKERVARILVFKIKPSQKILKIRDGTPLKAEGILTYRKSPRNCSVWQFSSKLDVPSNVVQKKRVACILVFNIRPSQEILKIRDGTPLEAEGILTYRKSPRNCSVWQFSSKLDVPSNVVQKKRLERILVFKIRPSKEILKIRDGTPLEAEEILTYRKSPRYCSVWHFSSKPSQNVLKIRDGTPLEAEGILTYRKGLRNCSVWHFSSKLDIPNNVVQKKRVARILVFKIRPSQKILKIRDGTPLEAEGILKYGKSPRNCSVWQFSSKLDVPSNVVQKKRVACILVFNIRPSQEILKIRDGTPLEAEGILTYRKSPRNCSVWQFSSKLDVPSNVVQKKRLERILVFKIRPSKEILKIRDGTPLEAEEILTYRKSPRYCSWHGFWFCKIRPSQNVLKIRDGTPLEAEGILTYRKGLRNCSVWHFSSKLDIPNNVVQKKRVARILVFKIRPSQKILKIRDGTPLEAEGILKYGKSPRNCSVWNFSSKLDVPSNVVKRERVARILVFKIRPSQKILKIRDGTPLEAEGILTYRKSPRNCSIWHFSSKPSQKILKIRDGTPLKAEGILTYRKSPRNCSVWHFSSKLDVPSNVVQKKRVARILVFKIRSSQEILKIRDGTPLEAEEILTYRKALDTARFGTFLLDVATNEVQKERVARILVFKIKPSQKILKIRDGTPLKAEGILTYRKSPRNCSVWQFSSKLDVPSNVVQKKRVACILVFNIRPSQEILKIRDGTPLEAEGILTYRKSPRNCSVWQFSSKLDVPSNVVQKKRLERILVFKIRPSKEILKIRDGTPLEAEEILTYRKSPRYCSWHGFWFCKIRPSQNVLKIRDGTPLEAEGILTYRKGLRNCSVWHFSSKLDIPNNVVQKKRVAQILVFKIRPSQKILKIRDGTPLEAEGILKYGKSPRNCSVWNFSSKLDVPSNVVKRERVARILVFKIRPSQKILKIRDGTPLEAEGILTYRKSPRNYSIWHFSSKPSQKILKIRDGTPLKAEGILTYRKSPRNCSVWHFSSKLDVPSNVVQKKRVARILVFKIRSSQEILKIRDGTPLEAEGILTYRKSPRNCSVWQFSSKLDVPSNVVQKKRVERILVFKIKPSQKILKIRDGPPLKLDVPTNEVQKERVARILVFKIKPSQKILKIRDGTPLKAEGILTYRKSPRNCSVWQFSSKLDVPSNVVQKKRVACILVFNIRPSQEILKIRDGTPLEAEGILTYRKSPRNCSVWQFSSKLDVPSNVVQKKRLERILVFKIRPSKEILKIRDGTPLEAEEILTYRKGLRNCSVWHFSSKLDIPNNVVQKKRVARILVFKIRPSQKILKIRDGTPLEAEGILKYGKSPRNCSVWQFSSKLDVPSNVVQKKRVACILVFNIRPSQEILKIRDGTPLEAEGILTYRKSPRNCSVWQFSSKLDVPSNVVQKKRLERILVFKIRPSKEILKIRDGTPLEAEEILTYRKSPRYCSVWHFSSKLDVPSNVVQKKKSGTDSGFAKLGILTYRKGLRNCSVWHFSSKLDIPNNVVQKKRVARILVFKIRPSQKILKIRDGTPLEAEGILKYGKSPRNCSVWNFSSKLDVPSNVVKRERVARILVFKIRPSQKILKIRDGTPLEAEGILTYRKSPRNCSIWHFSSKPSQKILKIRDGTPLKAEGILTYRKSPRNCSVWHFSSKLDVPSNVVQKKRVARILVFKIRSSQEILKIRDGTPLEAEEILTYRKALDTARFGTFLLDVATNEVQKERVARILVFKIKPSQKILKIRDGTPLKAEGILTYRKSPRNCSVWQFSSKLDVPSNVVQKKRVACILVFNIRPSQEILKIRDGTPLEAEGILTYRKSPRNCSVWQFSSKLDVPSNVVQKKRLERILVFKIRPSKEILKIRDGTPLEAEEILTYRKSPRYCSVWHFSSKPSQNVLKIRDGTPLEAEGILTYRKGLRNCSVWHFSSKLDISNNVVQKKRVARILVFKIRPSQKILKIRDGTPLEAEGILKYGKSPRNCSVWNFSSKLDVPSNVVKRERVARILVFKIRPSQKILKIRDGTPLEAEGILTYRKSPRNCSVWHFSSKLDVPTNEVQKERVARILVFKIKPSQKILKIRDGTPLKAEGILTYRKNPRYCSVWQFSTKLDVPSNVVQKKRVACILVFNIRPSQEILKIRDGTPLEAEGILTYRKSPRNCSVWQFSSKLDVPSNVVQKKRVERILVFKIKPSQKILKIRDGPPLKLDVPTNEVQKERVARILVFKIKPSQKILKIRDGTPLKAEGILTYRKSTRNCSVWQFSSKLDVPSNVVQKKRVACILVFNIRPSQEILKIRDGTPLEAEGILTYRKSPRNCSVWQFSSKLDVPSNVVQKKRLERILVFKIRPSKEILKIRDGTPLEAEEILTYRKSPRYCSVWHFSSKPSQNVLKIRDGTPLEAEGILTYRKGLRNCSVWHFSSKLDIPNNVVQKKRVAQILVFKIRPSQKILKIRDGTPLEAEGILKYGKSPRNCSVWNFSSKLDVPSNVVKRERVARILVFKIRPSQKILKIRDGTPLEAEGILTYRKSPRNYSIWPSQKILKIRDGTPLKAEGILTYRKSPRNCSVWHFSSKLDVPSNVVQKKRVARILVFKIRSSQEILKIRDGTPLEAEEILTYRKALDTARFGTFLLDVPTNEVQKERVARILVFKIKPSQKILKIRDGTPLKAEGILTYRKSPRNCSVWQFSSKLDVPSNVVQKKRVACILVFNIRPSQEILKIRDGTPLEAEGILTYRKSPRNCSVWQFSSKLDVPSNVVQKKRLERILVFKIRPSKEILKIRDGTPLEAEEILTYRKSPRYCSVWHFSSKPSQNVLKIRDGTPLEAEGILTYRKGLRNCSVWHFSSKLDIPNNVVQKKRVARILVFKIRPSQKILKIRDGTPLEAEGILKYGKSPRNCSVWNFSSKLDVPSNVVKRERVARILVFKIRPSQKILKIRDGTPLEAEGILTYRKSPRNCSVWHFSSKLDVPTNEVQKERVARILVFKIKPSQKILKIRDGTPLKAEGILTYRKNPRNCSVWQFSTKLDVPSNVVQKKRVACILVFNIRPSQEILKIRDGTPLEAEGILTYRKSPRNCSVWQFSSKLDVPSNVVQKKRVERILVFKIRPSKEILKIRDGTPLEAEEILTYRKSPRYCSWHGFWFCKIRPSQNVLKIRDGTPLEAEGILTYRKGHRNCSVWHFSSKLDIPSNVVQKKRVARILVFKIRPSQKILKIRDGTTLEAEGILTYGKSPRNCSVWNFSSKLDVPSNVVKRERVARILVFKIRPSQKILKIRDGTPLKAEGILTYRKSPRNCSVWHFSSKLDVPSNVVQKKRVARIIFFKIRSSQEILKIRDGTPLEAEEILTYKKALDTARFGTFLLDVPTNEVQKERVARILVFKIKPSQKILKIRDGTPLKAEGILTYRKSPRNCSVWQFSSKLDVPSNVVQKKRVACILVFNIRPSQEILKIRDGTPLEAEGILTYRKSPRNCSVWQFSSKLDVPSNVVQKKRLERILVFKIRPSKEILKIRDGTPLEAEEILTYRKSPRYCSWHGFWFCKIRPSQNVLKIRDGTPLEAEGILTYRKGLRNCSVWHFSSKLDIPNNVVQKKRVARILVFKIRPSQKILKIRDGTPLEAEGILKYGKSPRNCSVWNFSSKLDVPSNVVKRERVARILVFKIRPSQKILKIRDGTPLEAEGILTYRKSPRNCSVWHFSSKLDVPTNEVQKERVARILVFKIKPSQKILKIRDGTPLKAEGILTYRKNPRNCSVWQFSTKLDVPSNVVQKKRVACILVFNIRPSQEILKIRDGTPLEAEGILTYRKSPRNCSVWQFSSKLDVPSNVVQKKRVERILVFKIRPSKEILKIRDGTPLEAEEILTYRKSPRYCSVWHFSSKLDVPSNVVQKKKSGTDSGFAKFGHLKIKGHRNCSVWHFSSKLDIPSNVVQKKRVARILVFKIRPSQKILKIRDGTTLEAEGILTYGKSPRNCSVWNFSSKLDVPSNVVKRERVARILVFKIRPSQKILKIRDGTPLKAEGILTYRKSPRNCSVWHFSSKLDVPSNVVQKKRVARIIFFKIRSSQEILKIRDGTPLEAEEILTYKKALDTARFGTFLMSSQKILKIRDGTPLEAEGILTYIKSPRNCSVWHFSSKLDVPSNVVQKERVACILVFKIRPSQEILKIRDGTPLEAEGILTYRKRPRNCSVWQFSSKLDVPSNVVQKKRVERILVFKIRPSKEILKIRDGTLWRPSQKILKIRDGTPLKAEGILTYRKSPRNCSVWHFSSKLDVPSNVVQKKRVARILFFKIRSSQEILKIRDGTPLEAEEILTYRKALDTARFGTFLMSSQEILKIRDGQKKRVACILVFKIRPSQEILKIRDGTPLEAEGILTYRKRPRNCSVWQFYSKLDVPSNVVQKKRVERILVFKIRPSKEILNIRDGTPLEAEGILTYGKSPRNCSDWNFSSKLDVPSNVVKRERVARILVFKIRPSQKILKIRDGTPLKAEGILTYRKSPRNCPVWQFSSKLDVPSNVVQKKRVACILVFKIRPSQEILKIRDGTPLEAEGILTYRKRPRNCSVWQFSSKLDVPSNVVQKKRVERILVFKIRPSKEILKIRDGTLWRAEGILTYRKSPRNCSVWHFSSKLDVPSNVVQKKRVARILFFKIRSSQEILKIRDGTPLEAEEILAYRKALDTARFGTFLVMACILVFKIRPSQEILKIRDGTPLEAEGILTYRKRPRNCSVWQFYSKLDVPSNVVQKKRVERILVFKIRPSKEILKIRDGTPLEAEGILTYGKSPRNCSDWNFSSKLDVPSNVVKRERVARILVFKIRPSQKILKIRDGTPLKAEGILTYRKSPRNCSVWHFSSKLDVPSNVVQKKRVARILFFKIRSSQEILKIRDGTPLEAEEILTYRKALDTARFDTFLVS
ncbi:hypothetical protein OROMI_024545 [Orobanche minor]